MIVKHIIVVFLTDDPDEMVRMPADFAVEEKDVRGCRVA